MPRGIRRRIRSDAERKHIFRQFAILRAKAGAWTQIETAERSGISRDRYMKIEHGKVEPTRKELRTLARIFDVPLKKLPYKLPEPATPNGADSVEAVR